MKKIFSVFAISAVAMMTVFSCNKSEQESSNPLPMPQVQEEELQGLEISPKTSYVVIGEELSLSVAYLPSNAAVSSVEWTTSNTEVASVDASGHVKAVGTGIAMIKASAQGKSVTAIVNVYSERVPATAIALNKTEVSLLVGRATQVRANLLPDGSEEGQAGTTDKPAFEWTSSDEAVAVVSYGFIKAVGMGEAIVTVRQGEISAEVKVTVADKIKLVDRSEAWTFTDTPKWDKNWSGTITGSHVEVVLSACDAERHYFKVVSADKFTSVEEISNDVYTAVEEKKDAGEDPSSLFASGESQTVNYSDMGAAVAYVLGFDAECEFTGEYAVYSFEGRTPDPVHATGIQFTTGWSDTPITEITLREGKTMSPFSAKLLPEDCTDTGSISFKSSDESVVKLSVYYSNYYTVTAVAQGEADIIATFNDIEASIHVTVTGNDVVLTDHSSEWAASKTVAEQWGWTVVNINVTACTAPRFYALVTNDKPAGATLKGTLCALAEGVYTYYIQSSVPAEFQSWDGDGRYIVILGFTDSGDFSGDYAIIDTEGGDQPGGDQPGGDQPSGDETTIVSFDAEGQYLQNTFDSTDAVQDELTLEGWFNPSSLTGGGDGIRVLWGTEGIFLLRYEGDKLHLVYGGKKRTDKNEYEESNIVYSTSMQTNEWHHIAATYKRSEKARLYVDGVEVATGNAEDHAIELNGLGAQWDLPFSFIIGAAGQAKRNFLGSMAYLRVWDVARTADEISANMNVAAPSDEGYNLLAAWNFTEGSGSTIADHGATEEYDITSNGTLSWINGTLPF